MRPDKDATHCSMPIDVEQFHRELARLASEGAPPERIACRAALVWRNVAKALSPIIGHGGVAALFKRSVAMTNTTYPWLGTMQQDGLDPSGIFTALQTALSQQPSADAAAGNSAVLLKFIEILTSLIGESLVGRLLSTVWDESANDDSREPQQ